MVQIRRVSSGSSFYLCKLQRLLRCLPFLIPRLVLRLFCVCSYTNYARLVMFSFGFQKAFQRGFEPDDEVFFTKVRSSNIQCQPKLMPTGHSQRAWKAPRPSSRYSSILWSRRVIYALHQTVRKLNVDLVLSVLTPLIYIGYFVFAAFASAFMLKVRDRPFYPAAVLARVSDYTFTAAYAPGMFGVHYPRARSRDLSGH